MATHLLVIFLTGAYWALVEESPASELDLGSVTQRVRVPSNPKILWFVPDCQDRGQISWIKEEKIVAALSAGSSSHCYPHHQETHKKKSPPTFSTQGKISGALRITREPSHQVQKCWGSTQLSKEKKAVCRIGIDSLEIWKKCRNAQTSVLQKAQWQMERR